MDKPTVEEIKAHSLETGMGLAWSRSELYSKWKAHRKDELINQAHACTDFNKLKKLVIALMEETL